MKSKFFNLCKIILEDCILLESCESFYNAIILESLLNCPTSLFKTVKEAVQKLINENDFTTEIRIGIFEAINDNYCKELDNEIYNILVDLFKDYQDAYFKVKICRDEDSFNFTKECGEFSLPLTFKNIVNSQMIQDANLKFPKIKNLSIDNVLIKNFCQEYNKKVKKFKKEFNKRNLFLELFRNIILNSTDKDFGMIKIYPDYCSSDDKNIDLPTLDDAIKHECQHLCIFLLSVAKTCAYIGIHFSNLNILYPYINIDENTAYSLKAEEFITLFSSYSNILIRIYKKIDDEKSINEFVKNLLNICLKNSNIENKYTKELKASRMFHAIKNFYLKIWQDSYYKKYDKVIKDGKFEKVVGSKFLNENKFNKLLNWTYRKLIKELHNEK